MLGALDRVCKEGKGDPNGEVTNCMWVEDLVGKGFTE